MAVSEPTLDGVDSLALESGLDRCGVGLYPAHQRLSLFERLNLLGGSGRCRTRRHADPYVDSGMRVAWITPRIIGALPSTTLQLVTATVEVVAVVADDTILDH